MQDSRKIIHAFTPVLDKDGTLRGLHPWGAIGDVALAADVDVDVE